jgi:hypothetical protein
MNICASLCIFVYHNLLIFLEEINVVDKNECKCYALYTFYPKLTYFNVIVENKYLSSHATD